ncbi:hypothetical protein IEQ34_020995 [Dendrobium chrysotoxum]|uniref:Uncharacterized protein n=1 Tax=Dendrobium chrysotoxum TaxID=161865 RepID=A0AAV7G4I4_DENCH|nr:hypothetical protein IEQ34_020995 [Dendrobium chrysotoxum]
MTRRMTLFRKSLTPRTVSRRRSNAMSVSLTKRRCRASSRILASSSLTFRSISSTSPAIWRTTRNLAQLSGSLRRPLPSPPRRHNCVSCSRRRRRLLFGGVIRADEVDGYANDLWLGGFGLDLGLRVVTIADWIPMAAVEGVRHPPPTSSLRTSAEMVRDVSGIFSLDAGSFFGKYRDVSPACWRTRTRPPSGSGQPDSLRVRVNPTPPANTATPLAATRQRRPAVEASGGKDTTLLSRGKRRAGSDAPPLLAAIHAMMDETLEMLHPDYSPPNPHHSHSSSAVPDQGSDLLSFHDLSMIPPPIRRNFSDHPLSFWRKSCHRLPQLDHSAFPMTQPPPEFSSPTLYRPRGSPLQHRDNVIGPSTAAAENKSIISWRRMTRRMTLFRKSLTPRTVSRRRSNAMSVSLTKRRCRASSRILASSSLTFRSISSTSPAIWRTTRTFFLTRNPRTALWIVTAAATLASPVGIAVSAVVAGAGAGVFFPVALSEPTKWTGMLMTFGLVDSGCTWA